MVRRALTRTCDEVDTATLWRHESDRANPTRRLFDFFAWSGYAGEDGGVPCESSEEAMREAATLHGTCIPITKSSISFTQQAKPLNKMLVKALYL